MKKESVKEKIKVIAIVGPTASGKSDLALILARKFNGEVVSADSRQVYRGLDIGSGKITRREMKEVPHHMLDVANPQKIYTVSQYQKAASKFVRYIVQKDRLPIICGGTGFYIDSLLTGTSLPPVPPNKNLRKKLVKKSVSELYLMLKKLDPRRAKEIDRRNPVRLIRAIEIAKALGKVPKFNIQPSIFNVLKIGVRPENKELKKRIRARLLKRLRQGMIKEVKNLHKNGVSWKRLESFGLEYRFVANYLQNKLSKEEMISKLETAIWQYAKRQLTWFKRDKEIKWVTPSQTTKTVGIIKKWLSGKHFFFFFTHLEE